MDKTLGSEILLEPDLLVLSAAIRPQADAEKFASILKLPLTQEKFYMEAHMKLRRWTSSMRVCTSAVWRILPRPSANQSRRPEEQVSRALTVLSQPHLMVGE
jgi:heterodisulfide reductase subunit A